jgi:hypothetical protein
VDITDIQMPKWSTRAEKSRRTTESTIARPESRRTNVKLKPTNQAQTRQMDATRTVNVEPPNPPPDRKKEPNTPFISPMEILDNPKWTSPWAEPNHSILFFLPPLNILSHAWEPPGCSYNKRVWISQKSELAHWASTLSSHQHTTTFKFKILTYKTMALTFKTKTKTSIHTRILTPKHLHNFTNLAKMQMNQNMSWKSFGKWL